MAFSEKISVVIDLAVDKAGASLKSFKSQLAEADGAVGKMKVGFGAAAGFMKANAAELAATAGAALIGFAVKAVGEFQNLALAVGKTADATGVSSEAISRWAEVAGDVGVELGTVEKALLKMEEAAAKSPQAFADLGVEIARTADGAFDANETLIRAMETIGKMPSADERAAAGKKLLGKSWAEMAEIIESNDIRGALAGVSDAKVIDEAEVAKARKFRDALDNLKGVAEDLTLEVGGALVPALTDSAEAASGAVDAFKDFQDLDFGKVGEIAGTIGDLVWNLDNVSSGAKRAGDDTASGFERVAGAAEGLLGAIPIVGEGVSALNNELFGTAGAAEAGGWALDKFGAAALGAAVGEAKMAENAAVAEKKVTELQSAYDRMLGSLSEEQAYLDVQDGFDAVEQAAIEAYDAAANGAADAEQKARDYQSALIGQVQRLVEYGAKIGALPAAKLTQVEALVDKGKYDEAMRLLDSLTANRRVSLQIEAKGGAGYGTLVGPGTRRASGGPVVAGREYIVGEQGPELVTFGHDGMVLGAGRTNALAQGSAGGSTGGGTNIYNVTVQAGIVATDVDQAVVEAIKRAERRGLM